MAQDILQVENLSKLYKLGEINTGSISSDLQRLFCRIRGKEDPYEKLADPNDRNAKGNSDYIWTLKDISFSVKKGEVFGIIGKNGAGKSTLLKLLSKITKPTKGTIKIGGRIASLLEVGTGFHPDLSGRENIFLNGAILGMRKNEIKNRFDEIVEFSGIGRYLDTPVKRYSSGMFVRLAFAVAAHLEQEILIVDEVLAVGDADFQKKCIGKMQDVSRNQGRTVLFVSHNIAAVKQLCNRAMLLEKGRTKLVGSVESVLDMYQETEKDKENGVRSNIPKEVEGYFSGWKIEGGKSADPHSCYTGDRVVMQLEFQAFGKFNKSEVALRLLMDDGAVLLLARSSNFSKEQFVLDAGKYAFKFEFDLPVKPGKYELQMAFLNNEKFVDVWTPTTKLHVLDTFGGAFQDIYSGILNIPSRFEYAGVGNFNYAVTPNHA